MTISVQIPILEKKLPTTIRNGSIDIVLNELFNIKELKLVGFKESFTLDDSKCNDICGKVEYAFIWAGRKEQRSPFEDHELNDYVQKLNNNIASITGEKPTHTQHSFVTSGLSCQASLEYKYTKPAEMKIEFPQRPHIPIIIGKGLYNEILKITFH